MVPGVGRGRAFAQSIWTTRVSRLDQPHCGPSGGPYWCFTFSKNLARSLALSLLLSRWFPVASWSGNLNVSVYFRHRRMPQVWHHAANMLSRSPRKEGCRYSFEIRTCTHAHTWHNQMLHTNTQCTSQAKKIETATQAKHGRMHARKITRLRHARLSIFFWPAWVVAMPSVWQQTFSTGAV